MAHLIVTVDVPGDPEDVFDYLSNFSNTAEWDPAVIAAEILSGEDGIEVGTEFLVVVSFLGAETEFTYTMTALERPYRFRLEGGNGLVISRDDITVTPAAGGVRVTYDATLELPWYMSAVDPLLQAAFGWTSGATIEGLRETLLRRSQLPRPPRDEAAAAAEEQAAAEAAEQAAREAEKAARRIAKQAAKRAAKQLAKQVAKQAAKHAAKEAAKQSARQSGRRGGKDAAKKDTTKKASRRDARAETGAAPKSSAQAEGTTAAERAAAQVARWAEE